MCTSRRVGCKRTWHLVWAVKPRPTVGSRVRPPPALLPPPPQGDVTGARPFKVCTVFLLVCLYGQQSPTHAGAGTVRAGCSRSGDREAPGMYRQVPGSQPWAGCSPPSRRGPKRCPTIPMDPGRLPEGGGVESHLGIPSSPPIPCLRREGNLHFEREEEERPIRSPLNTRASSLATCSHIG